VRSEARAFRRAHPMLPSTPTSASAPHSTHIGTYHAAHPITVYASWPRLPVYVTVARVRRTTTQDSLPVWRPPPFTVGTFTRGSRLKVSGATSFLFVQDYPGAM
jgi:hypothetical protein